MVVSKMDELKHYGVKGMKWGVIRSKIQKVNKSHIKKRNIKEKASLEKYHEKNKNNPKYKKAYKKHSSETKTQVAAIRRTRNEMKKQNADSKKRIETIVVSSVVIAKGVTATALVARSLATPSNIRRGKNIVQAIKRSPIRYVDGSKMKNVINP